MKKCLKCKKEFEPSPGHISYCSICSPTPEEKEIKRVEDENKKAEEKKVARKKLIKKSKDSHGHFKKGHTLGFQKGKRPPGKLKGDHTFAATKSITKWKKSMQAILKNHTKKSDIVSIWKALIKQAKTSDLKAIQEVFKQVLPAITAVNDSPTDKKPITIQFILDKREDSKGRPKLVENKEVDTDTEIQVIENKEI